MASARRVDVVALVPAGWDLEPLRAEPLGDRCSPSCGRGTYAVEAAETVTAATELARLSLNIAHTHTDAGASAHGRRLVYGGHVIGVAASHVTRALPDLATILAWESCDHLGPTFEGDRLRSRVEITRLRAVRPTAGWSTCGCGRPPRAIDERPRDVLDWRLVALMP